LKDGHKVLGIGVFSLCDMQDYFFVIQLVGVSIWS
jgi:hypothetical protein